VRDCRPLGRKEGARWGVNSTPDRRVIGVLTGVSCCAPHVPKRGRHGLRRGCGYTFAVPCQPQRRRRCAPDLHRWSGRVV